MTTTNTNRLAAAIVKAGFIAGLLDITAATIQYLIVRQQEPTRMYQYIASGLFGKEAFSGGLPMALLGLVFHFMIAYLFTIIFFLIYPKIKLLAKNRLVTGIAYGLVVWVIMNRLVVPVSNTPKAGTFNPVQALIGAGILIVCIGIPLSFMAYKYYIGNKAHSV